MSRRTAAGRGRRLHLGGGACRDGPKVGTASRRPYVDAVHRRGARRDRAPGETGDPEDISSRSTGCCSSVAATSTRLVTAGRDAEHTYGVEPDRDELEIDLLLAADASSLPTLAICRGMQVMNVAFGGTLHHTSPTCRASGARRPGADTRRRMTSSRSPEAARGHDQVRRPAAFAPSPGRRSLGDGLVATGLEPGRARRGDRARGGRPDESRDVDGGVQWHPGRHRGHRSRATVHVRGARHWSPGGVDPGQAGERRADARVRSPTTIRSGPVGSNRRHRSARRSLRPRLGDRPRRVDLGARTPGQANHRHPGLGDLPHPTRAYIEPLKSIGYQTSLDPSAPHHEFFSRAYEVEGLRRFQSTSAR